MFEPHAPVPSWRNRGRPSTPGDVHVPLVGPPGVEAGSNAYGGTAMRAARRRSDDTKASKSKENIAPRNSGGFDGDLAEGATPPPPPPPNRYVTSRYTVWSFLPLNLLHHFSYPLNVYYLIYGTLLTIPGLSPLPWFVILLPFSISLIVAMCRDGRDDYLRHLADDAINRRPFACYHVERWGNGRTTTPATGSRSPSPGFASSPSPYAADSTVVEGGDGGGAASPPLGPLSRMLSQDIAPGNVLLLPGGMDAPCDVIPIASSDPAGTCVVDTSNIDGESRPQIRRCLLQWPLRLADRGTSPTADDAGTPASQTAPTVDDEEVGASPSTFNRALFHGFLVGAVNDVDPWILSRPLTRAVRLLAPGLKGATIRCEPPTSVLGRFHGVALMPHVAKIFDEGEPPSVTTRQPGSSSPMTSRYLLRQEHRAAGRAPPESSSHRGDESDRRDDRQSAEDSAAVLDASPPAPPRFPLEADCLIVGGSRISMTTTWVLVVAVYTGDDTKLFCNRLPTTIKRSQHDIRFSTYSLRQFLAAVILTTFLALMHLFYAWDVERTHFYLRSDAAMSSGGGEAFGPAAWQRFSFIYVRFLLLFGALVPLSAKILVDSAKWYFGHIIDVDDKYYDDGSRSRPSGSPNAILKPTTTTNGGCQTAQNDATATPPQGNLSKGGAEGEDVAAATTTRSFLSTMASIRDGMASMRDRSEGQQQQRGSGAIQSSTSPSRYRVNSTAVVEDLGEIRYLISDKTGTLTRNELLLHSVYCCGMLFSSGFIGSGGGDTGADASSCLTRSAPLASLIPGSEDPSVSAIANRADRWLLAYACAMCNTCVPFGADVWNQGSRHHELA